MKLLVPIMGVKGCLVYINFMHMNLMISKPQINFLEEG